MSEEQQEQVILGPGEILRRAREKENFSAQDIADKIRLKKSLIEDIELDNYDINISQTFIKGYLKLYAKQVQVSEVEIAEAFEKLNTQKKEPAKLQSFSRRFANQANDDKLMLVTYFILAVVIALVVIWWFQQSDNEPASVPEVSVEKVADDESFNTKIVERFPEEPIQESELLPEDTQNNELANTLPVKVEAEAIAADAKVNEEPNEHKEPDLDTPQLLETNNEQENVEAIGDAEFASPVELIFEFADDCWMNLSDATGENIAYGVKVKGRTMPVSGIPPFSVTLGAPEVVKISYAGEPLDMSFLTPGRTAKFNLPLTE